MVRRAVRLSTTARAFRFGDVALNVASAGVFALGLMTWASRMDQAAFAASLVEYSLAIVLAWILTLGAPTRFVSLAGRPVEELASVVWQTVLIGFAVYVTLLSFGFVLVRLGDWHAHEGRWARLAVLTPIALLGYVGREVSNIAFGRAATAFGCFVQIALGTAVCYVLMLQGILDPLVSATLFLAVYYTAGGLPLIVFLFRHRPDRSVSQLAFIRETGRTNLALGFSTLLLGSVDKILLGVRPLLNNAEVAYVIADRLAGAYATVMTYYSQSRVQSAITGREWENVRAVDSLDRWLRHAAPSLAAFSLVGAAVLASASFSIGLPASIGSIAALVGAICMVAYLKSGSGYAIRLLDIGRSGEDFNRIAVTLGAACAAMLALTHAASVIYIVAGKLVLHVLMLALLRHTCKRMHTTP